MASGGGLFTWIVHRIQDAYSDVTHFFTDPNDTEETDEEVQEYITQVITGTPFRDTKCMFVTEMNEVYSDEELNTIYHSADEYRNAVTKYGYIYKTQKFENADTVEKLYEYACDWIKNNYHGGIQNFTVTALDLHLMGNDVKKYVVGGRVPVMYRDPIIRQETEQVLTVITAEYDLNNPDKNQYKIGIPDVTLNKVYGETSKSGGGGGGGGKASDETDGETQTELDDVGDSVEEDEDWIDSTKWAFFPTIKKNGDGSFDLSNLIPPQLRDASAAASDFVRGISAHAINTINFGASIGSFQTSVEAPYIRSSGGVDTETLSANKSNTGRTNATSIDVVEGISTKTIKIDGKQFINNGLITITDKNGVDHTISAIRMQ